MAIVAKGTITIIDVMDGANGSAVTVTANRALSFTSTDGILDSGQPNITLTATTNGISNPTFVWSFNGFTTAPVNSATFSQTITAAQFGTAKSAMVTCTVNGQYTETVSIFRLEKSSAAPGATVGAEIGVNLFGRFLQASVSSLFDDKSIPGVKISTVISSDDWNGAISPSGLVTTPGTTGWVISKGDGTPGSSKIEIDAAHIRGTLSVGQLNINDYKSAAGSDRRYIYSAGTAVPNANGYVKFCDFVSSGYVSQANVSGNIVVYLNTNTATTFSVSTGIRAVSGTTTLDLATQTQTVSFNGGIYYSYTNGYTFNIPLSVFWVFGGSYVADPGSPAPGRASTQDQPYRVENFLTQGSWELYAYISVIAYNPGTNTLKTCITHITSTMVGSAISIPGALRYDPPLNAGAT